MKVFAAAFVGIIVTASAAFAQTAPLSPSQQSVVDACSAAVGSQGTASTPGANSACLAATQAYLDALKSSVPADVLNQNVTDLVVKLSAIAQADPKCDTYDDEVAKAINLASNYTTGDQQVQIRQISVTIAQCLKQTTAAIGPKQASPV
jgi:hypothetical protein